MSVLSKVSKLYFTLKPLRFEQVWFRVWRHFFPLKKLQGSHQRLSTRNWNWASPEFMSPKFLSKDEVSFLNLSAKLEDLDGWNDNKYEKLWLYNLHYFDDLNAIGSVDRIDIQKGFVNKWIEDNVPVSGNGWEPYPLSLRIVNWIKWFQKNEIKDEHAINSLSQQAEALTKQLEYHILGNHLFANGKALVFLGCFFNSKESDAYLKSGLKILEREIQEQFLADGGHFELSPMYHNILLWDLLDLINLAQENSDIIPKERVTFWKETAEKAIRWIKLMIHPDGEVSFFNDAAIGIAASPYDIFAYAKLLGLNIGDKLVSDEPANLVTLKETGYTRIKQSAYLLFFDHAEIGPDYLPAHGHADALSFECSVGENRFIVNSGTSVYGLSDERLRQRKTPAHSTVVVDDEDSSEVWSGFRVARRANITNLLVREETENVFRVSATHDGYKRFSGKVHHHRTIESSMYEFEIVDRLDGQFNKAYAVFHLHPDVVVEKCTGENTSEESLKLSLPDGATVLVSSTNSISVEPSSWHPRFGQSIDSKCLKIYFDSKEIRTKFTIECKS